MSAYHVFLYIHLLALVAASATSSVVHMAQARARRAASVPEIRQWLMLAGSTARIFPIATLALLVTGGLMVSLRGPWSWSAGWVEAGLVGVLFLLLSGPFLGIRGQRAGRSLASLAPGEVERAQAVLHDPVAGALSWANTGIALGVVYAMVAKPGLAGSLTALVLGAITGVAFHVVLERRRSVAATTTAPSRELAA